MKVWYLTRFVDLIACENTPRFHQKRLIKHQIVWGPSPEPSRIFAYTFSTP